MRWQGIGRGEDGLAAQFADAADTADATGKGVVRFFPDGAATGGRVRMSVNGGGWDVDVGWLTGEVRMSRVQAAQ